MAPNLTSEMPEAPFITKTFFTLGQSWARIQILIVRIYCTVVDDFISIVSRLSWTAENLTIKILIVVLMWIVNETADLHNI